MNVNQLRIFHAVAQLLSFTRAAEELCLTQPGISKHVKELEAYYGTRLFHRLGKTVALTQAGEILYKTTGQIFYLIDESRTRIHDLCDLVCGKLTIGASIPIGYYLLPDLLVKFKRLYPGIEIKMSIAFSGQIVDRVLDNKLELGLVGHYTPDNMLAASTFLKDRLILISSSSHPWTKRKSIVQLSELVEVPFCISSKDSGTWKFLSNWFQAQGVTLDNLLELGTTEAVKKAVVAGLGVSMVPRHVLHNELQTGQVKEIAFSGNEATREFYLVHHKDRYLSEAAQAFLRLMGTADSGSLVGEVAT